MHRVLVLHGPNLNLLGTREPDVYGRVTFEELNAALENWGKDLDLTVSAFQSNHEGALIDAIHQARSSADGILINAGALTHYSYALHDAIRACGIPTVEIHISDVRSREEWRARSVISPACDHVIFGRGTDGYRFGLERLVAIDSWPYTRVSYGDLPDQYFEMRRPVDQGPSPTIALIHGGFWKNTWTLDTMDAIAVDLTKRGYTTCNIEYRTVGGGGGWPQSMEDIRQALHSASEVTADDGIAPPNLTALGHSAGGHLALLAGGLTGWGSPVQVAALAPVSDLSGAFRSHLGSGAVRSFMGGRLADLTEEYSAASPLSQLPLGMPHLVVHGILDDVVPVEMSRRYAAAAQAAGDDITIATLADSDHMDVIDPASTAWLVVLDWLSRGRD